MKTFKLRGPEAREVIARALAEERRLVSGRDLERLDYLEPLLYRHLDLGGDHAAIAAVLLVLCDRSRRLRLNPAADIALRRGAVAEGKLAERRKQARNVAPKGGKGKAEKQRQTRDPELSALRKDARDYAKLYQPGPHLRHKAADYLAAKPRYSARWKPTTIYKLIGTEF